MAKVLVVTNHFGYLHINPLSTKDYYLQQNVLTKESGKQYKLQEMDEDKANELVEKNNGFDPQFKNPQQVQAQIADKDAEIKRLREELAKQNDPNDEIAKLRAQLAEMSTAKTSQSDYSNAGANANLEDDKKASKDKK